MAIPGTPSDTPNRPRFGEATPQNESGPAVSGQDGLHSLLHERRARRTAPGHENESLHLSSPEIEAKLDRLADFYDFADVGFFTLAKDGMIVETNFAGAALIGLDRARLAGKNFMQFIAAERRQDFISFLTQVFEGRIRRVCDTVLQKSVNTPSINVHVNATARKSAQECHLVVSDITERMRMEQALHEKEFLLSESQRIARIGSWSLAVKEDYVRCTDETYSIYGVTPETFTPTVRNWIALIHAKDQPAMREWIRACLAGEQPGELEFRVTRSDGSVRILEGRGNLQHAPDGTPLRLIGTVQDVTERKRIQQELLESEALFRTITEMLDTEGRRIYNSPSYRRVFMDTVLKPGSDSFSEIHPEDRDRIKAIFQRTVSTGMGERAEFRFQLADGSVRHVESEGNAVVDESGKVTRVILVSRDVTGRKLAEEQIQHLANYDILTDLPNRRLFTDRLQRALAAARREKTVLAVLFLDLDMFKQINDTLGHDAGDLVLKETARRLQGCLRESDSAARMGGDEFVVILPGLQTAQAAIFVAEKICDALDQPFELAGHSVHVTSSIGIAIYPDHGNGGKELLKNADDAMYYAKASGRNAVKLFQAGQQEPKRNLPVDR
jgi:diguanylate cyclase (GGDEF)-like protein/PAS domain S-box-containing protein